jgi:hypothetical protein
MPGRRARSSYTIDGGSPTIYSPDEPTTGREGYRSPMLPNTQHTLTVTNLDYNRPLYLDFFLVYKPDDIIYMSSSSSTTMSISTSVASNSNAHNATTWAPSTNDRDFKATSTTLAVTNTTSTTLAVTNTTGSSAQSRPTASSTLSPNLATKPRNPGQILLIVGPTFGAIVACGIIYLLLRRWQKQKQLDSGIIPASKPFVNFQHFMFGSRTSSAFDDPIRFLPAVRWVNGQKPSSFSRDLDEPPPYVHDPGPQPSSHLLTLNRQPANFRTE